MITRFRRSRADRPASCREVVRVLQAYLDGEVDNLTARRVQDHLEDCRRCGLEASTYAEIKDSLQRHRAVSPEAVQRLRSFGERLARNTDRDDPNHRDTDPNT